MVPCDGYLDPCGLDPLSGNQPLAAAADHRQLAETQSARKGLARGRWSFEHRPHFVWRGQTSEIEIRKGELDVYSGRSRLPLWARRRMKKIGGRPIFYLKHYKFEGDIYPINPNYDEIQGVKAYKSLSDVPGDVELALIALPAMVEEAVQACAEKGVKATVIFSSGRRATMARRRRQLLQIGRDAGMRIMGPGVWGSPASTPA